MTNVIIVGPGRAGLSLADALAAPGPSQRGWRLGTVVGRGEPLGELARSADVVVLAVPDDQIAEAAAAVEPGPAAVVHLSGASGLDVLAPHRRRASVHPLMSLPDPVTGAKRLTGGGTFAVAGDRIGADLVAALGGRAIEVPDELRPLYHAAASVAANHLVALCAQVERLADACRVPVDAYWDLMATTLDNVRRSGALSSLTGPAARGDHTTIAQHLAALPPHERELYIALATEAARLASQPLPPGPPPAGNPSERRQRPMTDTGIPTSQSLHRSQALHSSPLVIESISGLRAVLDDHRRRGRTIGFVPTMGYLHDGHASLMRRAAADDDIVVASIFVNPLQFAPSEDLATYPRDLGHDTEVAAANGVDLLFVPSGETMYPDGRVVTSVSVAELSARWEGASRPTHFAGVATVVSKLFNIIGPCRAYFGEKDFQQLVIVRRMVADLSIPVEVVGCPIVREVDGVAMSSRNVHLAGPDREAATVLRWALDEGEQAIVGDGVRDPAEVGRRMAAVIEAEPRATLDYTAAVDPVTLIEPTAAGLGPEVRLLVAARLGTTRLIDNCGVTLSEETGG